LLLLEKLWITENPRYAWFDWPIQQLSSSSTVSTIRSFVFVLKEFSLCIPCSLSLIKCFWHIQHEFIEGEKTILGRDPHQFTAATGYAGGKSTDNEGRVCYHNFQGIADYGKLGNRQDKEIEGFHEISQF
jgi:hypothetical protein